MAQLRPARRDPLRRLGELLLERDEPLAERGDAEALPLRQPLLRRFSFFVVVFFGGSCTSRYLLSSAELERAADLARRALDRVERCADVRPCDDVVDARPQPAPAAEEVDAGAGLRA